MIVGGPWLRLTPGEAEEKLTRLILGCIIARYATDKRGASWEP